MYNNVYTGIMQLLLLLIIALVVAGCVNTINRASILVCIIIYMGYLRSCQKKVSRQPTPDKCCGSRRKDAIETFSASPILQVRADQSKTVDFRIAEANQRADRMYRSMKGAIGTKHEYNTAVNQLLTAYEDNSIWKNIE